MSHDGCKRQPDIDYPCRWTYKIIGAYEGALREAAAAIVGEREHLLELSNRSASGRFISLTLELTVSDEQERRRIFAELSAHRAVRVVL